MSENCYRWDLSSLNAGHLRLFHWMERNKREDIAWQIDLWIRRSNVDSKISLCTVDFLSYLGHNNWILLLHHCVHVYHCYVVAERCQVDSHIFISSFFQPNYTDTCWHIPDFLVKKELLSVAWSLAMIMTRWLAVSECHNRGFSSDCSASNMRWCVLIVCVILISYVTSAKNGLNEY